jgi:proteasome lid subunit RPN8/RPN11
MKSIKISRQYIDILIQHARAGAPEEVCGILAGAGDEVVEVFEMVNTEHSPVSYFMDPKEQFQIMKAIREKGLKMVAIYHSHPASEAFPSAKDVRLAFYDDLAYIISSLMNDEPIVRAFSIKEGRVEELEIVPV